jgi:pimeloyl-ACP methyl ester carboxylesterase
MQKLSSMERRDERVELAGVPVRICAPSSGTVRATILFYHGLGVDTEIQTPELHSLADAGFRVIGVDAVGHGRRRWDDFVARFAPHRWSQSFAEVLDQSLAEIPTLVDVLEAEGLLGQAALGVAGISMGGYISYGVPLVEPRVSAICPIIGSPVYPVESRYRPHDSPTRFARCSVLAQTAGADEIVAPWQARAFHELLLRSFPERQGCYSYVEYAGAGHTVPEQDWYRLWDRVISFFEQRSC